MLKEGSKTWTGLIITFLGVLGIGDLLGKENLAQFIDLVFQGLGLVLAMYGNYKAHQKIKELSS